MSAVPVTLIGSVTYDNGSVQNVTFNGVAAITGLSVGGGPIMPPDSGGGPPGSPAFPIWGPPGSNFPDKPGYPPVVGGGPIIPPVGPPDGGAPPPDGGDKPPPANGGWGFVSEWSQWGYFPGPTGAAPKTP
jgi:hypothetical protein